MIINSIFFNFNLLLRALQTRRYQIMTNVTNLTFQWSNCLYSMISSSLPITTPIPRMWRSYISLNLFSVLFPLPLLPAILPPFKYDWILRISNWLLLHRSRQLKYYRSFIKHNQTQQQLAINAIHYCIQVSVDLAIVVRTLCAWNAAIPISSGIGIFIPRSRSN